MSNFWKDKRPVNFIHYAVGDRIGEYCTYVSEAASVPKKRKIVAKCSCGKDFIVMLNKLRQGKTKSCGCYMKTPSNSSSFSHGRTKSPEYKSWCHMKDRCLNPKNHKYINYGARGIRVCKEWLDSFENFLADMGDKPGPGYTIDRIDNNGNYCPSNCKWSTPKEQSNNRRSSAFVLYKGKKMTISECADTAGIPYGSIQKYRWREDWQARHGIVPLPIIKHAA